MTYAIQVLQAKRDWLEENLGHLTVEVNAARVRDYIEALDHAIALLRGAEAIKDEQ